MGEPMPGLEEFGITPRRATHRELEEALVSVQIQTLTRKGRLWFFPDFSMYVYYSPTHWRPNS